MSEDKALPKGLQEEDMEKGKTKWPPVPYIPPVDPILDAVKSKSGTKKSKVSLPDETIVYHAIYGNGSKKSFMIHVNKVIRFCKRMDFYKSYKKAKTNFEDCTSRFMAAQQKLDKAIADPTTSADRMKALKKSLELATTAVVLAVKSILKRGKQFFSLYETLLG